MLVVGCWLLVVGCCWLLLVVVVVVVAVAVAVAVAVLVVVVVVVVKEFNTSLYQTPYNIF